MLNSQQAFDYLKQFLTPERIARIEHIATESSDFVLPVLEDVYQFRNAAAIVRSAEACGFHKVVAMEARNVFNPNLTVTKGAETWVEVEKIPHSLESLQQIRDRGYRLVAVSAEKNATPLPDFQIDRPAALIFGTEWQGVSQDFLEFVDETLIIPMYGFTQSFNVSVAAAICCYQLKQKLLQLELDYKLSPAKQLDLKIRWAINSIPRGRKVFENYCRKHHGLAR